MGIGQRLLNLVGMGKSQAGSVSMDKLRTARSSNQVKLEDLKDRIRELSQRAKEKKREHDAESNNRMKQIQIGELARILDELDALKSQDTIISRNLNAITLAMSKLDDFEAAQNQGVSESDADELAIELEDVFADLKEGDRATEALESVIYEHETGDVSAEVETRMKEFESDTAPQAEAESESEQDKENETLKRMRELDDEL